MTPEQFTYWLQGFFEISNSNSLTSDQVVVIKDHLKEVFNKVTPVRFNEQIVINPAQMPLYSPPPNPYQTGEPIINKPIITCQTSDTITEDSMNIMNHPNPLRYCNNRRLNK